MDFELIFRRLTVVNEKKTIEEFKIERFTIY